MWVSEGDGDESRDCLEFSETSELYLLVYRNFKLCEDPHIIFFFSLQLS